MGRDSVEGKTNEISQLQNAEGSQLQKESSQDTHKQFFSQSFSSESKDVDCDALDESKREHKSPENYEDDRPFGSCFARVESAVLEDTLYKPISDAAPWILGKQIMSQPLHDQDMHEFTEGKMRQYEVITLENKLIQVTICPALGGRVLSFKERESGSDLIFPTQTLHPIRVSTENIGGFIPGGIQFCLGESPFHPSSSQPTEFRLGNAPDGSSCWVTVGVADWLLHYEVREGLPNLYQRCIINKSSSFSVTCAVPVTNNSSWILPSVENGQEFLHLNTGFDQPTLCSLHSDIRAKPGELKLIRFKPEVSSLSKTTPATTKPSTTHNPKRAIEVPNSPLLHKRGQGRLSQEYTKETEPSSTISAPSQASVQFSNISDTIESNKKSVAPAISSPLVTRRGQGRLSRLRNSIAKPKLPTSSPTDGPGKLDEETANGEEEEKTSTTPRTPPREMLPLAAIGWENHCSHDSILVITPGQGTVQQRIRSLGSDSKHLTKTLIGLRGVAFAQLELEFPHHNGQYDICWAFSKALADAKIQDLAQDCAYQCRDFTSAPSRETFKRLREKSLLEKAHYLLSSQPQNNYSGENPSIEAKEAHTVSIQDLCGDILAQNRRSSNLRLVGLLYWKILGELEHAKHFLLQAMTNEDASAILELDTLLEEMGLEQDRQDLLFSPSVSRLTNKFSLPDIQLRQAQIELSQGRPRRALERLRGTQWTPILCSSERKKLFTKVRHIVDSMERPLCKFPPRKAYSIESDFMQEYNFQSLSLRPYNETSCKPTTSSNDSIAN